MTREQKLYAAAKAFFELAVPPPQNMRQRVAVTISMPLPSQYVKGYLMAYDTAHNELLLALSAYEGQAALPDDDAT